MFLRPPYSYSNPLIFACFFGGFWVDLLVSNVFTEIFTEDEIEGGGTLPSPPPPEWILILDEDFNWSYP